MPATITTNFKIHNAEQFIEAVSETANTNIYLFIAKPTQWGGNLDVDGTIPTISDNGILNYSIYDEILAIKKINIVDINHVVPRYNWTGGTVYNAYDDQSNTILNFNVIQNPFYVLSDLATFNVYKCIANSKGAPSLIKPTGESNEIISLGDGYKWKYMYTVPIDKRTKFLNLDYMFVSNVSSSAGVDGPIDSIIVTTPGNNYTSAPNIIITGNGSNATATAVLVNNTLSNVTITNKGINYRYANVVIEGGNGQNANARAIISPIQGHGSNSIKELGGYFVMVSVSLVESEDSVFPIDNDFRIVGLLKDPILYNTNTRASAAKFITNNILNLQNTVGTFIVDEFIVGNNSGANAYITSTTVLGSSSNVRYIQGNKITKNANSFIAAETVVGVQSGATANIQSITNTQIKPYSGEILYLDTFRPVQRDDTQTELIQLVIEF